MFFPEPSFQAQKKIIKQTLERLEAPPVDLEELDEAALAGLSGREVESVTFDFAKIKKLTELEGLNNCARAHKAERQKSWQPNRSERRPASFCTQIDLSPVVEAIQALPAQRSDQPNPPTQPWTWFWPFLGLAMALVGIGIAWFINRKRGSLPPPKSKP